MIGICLILSSTTLFAQEPVNPPIIRALAFSADGNWLAASSGEPDEGGDLVVWNLKARKAQFIHREKTGIPSVAFSPDSSLLAVGGFGDECKLLDAATGKPRTVLAGHGEAARGVAFSPDGKVLAVGCYDHNIRLWDVQAAKLLHTLEGHGDRVYDVAFSHDGTRLASVGPDKSIRIWDWKEGKLQKSFSEVGFRARSVHFGPEDKWLAVSYWESALTLRDADSGKVLFARKGIGGGDGLALSKDGSVAATTSGRFVFVHRDLLRKADTGEKKRFLALLERLDDDDITVREQAGQDLLKIGTVVEPFLAEAMKAGKSVEVKMRARRLREALLEQPDIRLEGHQATVHCVQFSPDGATLASAGRDGVIVFWDTKTWKKTGELRR
ncbi:MAG: WD40 repeat domain-containing protein [Planctomycetes bacterium]|nr:WD40 repeat domain-containing protein [Planctomycetota bacterium]